MKRSQIILIFVFVAATALIVWRWSPSKKRSSEFSGPLPLPSSSKTDVKQVSISEKIIVLPEKDPATNALMRHEIEQLRVGMTESDVTNLLGHPTFKGRQISAESFKRAMELKNPSEKDFLENCLHYCWHTGHVSISGGDDFLLFFDDNWKLRNWSWQAQPNN